MYFDQLLGAARTRKLVELLFFRVWDLNVTGTAMSFEGLVIYMCIFLLFDLSSIIIFHHHIEINNTDNRHLTLVPEQEPRLCILLSLGPQCLGPQCPGPQFHSTDKINVDFKINIVNLFTKCLTS